MYKKVKKIIKSVTTLTKKAFSLKAFVSDILPYVKNNIELKIYAAALFPLIIILMEYIGNNLFDFSKILINDEKYLFIPNVPIISIVFFIFAYLIAKTPLKKYLKDILFFIISVIYSILIYVAITKTLSNTLIVQQYLNLSLFIATIGLLIPIANFVQKFWKYTLIKFIVLVVFAYVSSLAFPFVNQHVSNVVGVGGHYFVSTLGMTLYDFLIKLLTLDSIMVSLLLILIIYIFLTFAYKLYINKDYNSFIGINIIRVFILVMLILKFQVNDADNLNKNYEKNIADNVYEYDMYNSSVCQYDLDKNQKIKKLTEKTALLATKTPSKAKDSDNVESNIAFKRVPCAEIKTLKP